MKSSAFHIAFFKLVLLLLKLPGVGSAVLKRASVCSRLGFMHLSVKKRDLKKPTYPKRGVIWVFQGIRQELQRQDCGRFLGQQCLDGALLLPDPGNAETSVFRH